MKKMMMFVMAVAAGAAFAANVTDVDDTSWWSLSGGVLTLNNSDADISILATPTLTGTPDGEGVSTYPLDPSGSTTIPQNGNATRFFRLQVLPHIEIVVPIIEGDDIEVVAPLN